MSTLSQRQGWLKEALRIAQDGGRVARHFYRAELAVHIKEGDRRNLVTEADLAVDEAIRSALAETFPEHVQLSEELHGEESVLDDSRPTWVIDPIDGTSNFAHELPLFAISIGLRHQGRSEVGVIHAPLLGWTFAAARGGGASWNDLPLRASRRATLDESIIACDWSRLPARRRKVLAAFGALGERAHTLRSMGSAALGLAAVAAGWVDLYFNYSLSPWDTAAGVLLVEEAGGQISALDGSRWQIEQGDILASNGRIHEEAVAIIAPHL